MRQGQTSPSSWQPAIVELHHVVVGYLSRAAVEWAPHRSSIDTLALGSLATFSDDGTRLAALRKAVEHGECDRQLMLHRIALLLWFHRFRAYTCSSNSSRSWRGSEIIDIARRTNGAAPAFLGHARRWGRVPLPWPPHA